jgi:two-component system response regulator WspF
LRIAIVNDAALVTEGLRRVVVSDPEHTVAWIAVNGEDAVARCQKELPDLILMDVLMPVMDGLEATRRIMRETPCPILLVTAHLETQTGKIFEALGAGAIDVVSTPRLAGSSDGKELLEKIRMVRAFIQPIAGRKLAAQAVKNINPQPSPERDPLIVIGASAGGPAALGVILSSLPGDLRAAVVIVQHIDAQFAPGLALWLASQSPLPVRLISAGDWIERGIVFLAATNDHLILSDAEHFAYTEQPSQAPCRPSVDVFFQSVVRQRNGVVVAALLTGMGSDGAAGLLALRSAGAVTIAQDKETSIVYGMPKAASLLGAAQQILPLDQIGPALTDAVREKRRDSGTTRR